MTDEPIISAFDANEAYTRDVNGSVQRGSDHALTPDDPGNSDWRAYQAGVASGRQPAPASATPMG